MLARQLFGLGLRLADVGMLMAARHIVPALGFVAALDRAAADLEQRIEHGKKAYAGHEIAGQTLGIIGLCKIGCLLADAAIRLGMHVMGYDPHITVDAAWSLSARVKRAANANDVLRNAQFVSLHVPLMEFTRETEENCAVMVVDQVRDYLEHGNVVNAVNFPAVTMPRESPWRVPIANANVPNMLGQISTTMAQAGLNIHNMVNKSHGEMVHTLVDVDSQVQEAVLQALAGIAGVRGLRCLPDAGSHVR